MSIKDSFLGRADLSMDSSKERFGSVTKSNTNLYGKTTVFVDGLYFPIAFRYVTRYKNIQQWVTV